MEEISGEELLHLVRSPLWHERWVELGSPAVVAHGWSAVAAALTAAERQRLEEAIATAPVVIVGVVEGAASRVDLSAGGARAGAIGAVAGHARGPSDATEGGVPAVPGDGHGREGRGHGSGGDRSGRDRHVLEHGHGRADQVLPVAGAVCDVLVSEAAAADEVVEVVEVHPEAAVALAALLRASERRSIADGLTAESSTYGMLQGGHDHRAWLAGNPPRPHQSGPGPAVLTERGGDRLILTLHRPEVRNAYDAQMRDELVAALDMAAADPSVTEVVVRGDGPSFCSGGDLSEFGTSDDPARSHVIRLARNAGRSLAAVADRTLVEVQGACVGAGVELPAFADRVAAHPEATFRLPEVAMGLVPGAGGTVSLPRRIGRHRTAWLALTGRAIDARTAQAWGLVDAIG